MRLRPLPPLFVLVFTSSLQAQVHFDTHGYGWEFGTPVAPGENNEATQVPPANEKPSSARTERDLPKINGDNPPQSIVACWNVNPSSPEGQIVLEVRFIVGGDGLVVPSSMELVSASGGDERQQTIAYVIARRAIMRCQQNGYTVPNPDENGEREVIMTFDPRLNDAD